MEHRYDFSDPQTGNDVIDRRITLVKSHIRRYINEGHDIKSAGDKKAAIDSSGGVKGGQAAVVKLQEHNHTMKKHTMSESRFSKMLALSQKVCAFGRLSM